MNKLTIIFFITLSIFIPSSCSSYYVSIQDLQKEFSAIDSAQLIRVKTKGIYEETYTYLANPINSISCIDRRNNTIRISNSPSVEMKVAETNKNITTLYLDRIFIKDSVLYGFESRISENLKRIPFS